MLPGPYARLRLRRFDERTTELGLVTDLAVAERLGVSEATVNRVRNGKVVPGERFIAAAVSELGLTFEQLFEIAQAS